MKTLLGWFVRTLIDGREEGILIDFLLNFIRIKVLFSSIWNYLLSDVLDLHSSHFFIVILFLWVHFPMRTLHILFAFFLRLCIYFVNWCSIARKYALDFVVALHDLLVGVVGQVLRIIPVLNNFGFVSVDSESAVETFWEAHDRIEAGIVNLQRLHLFNTNCDLRVFQLPISLVFDQI